MEKPIYFRKYWINWWRNEAFNDEVKKILTDCVCFVVHQHPIHEYVLQIFEIEFKLKFSRLEDIPINEIISKAKQYSLWENKYNVEIEKNRIIDYDEIIIIRNLSKWYNIMLFEIIIAYFKLISFIFMKLPKEFLKLANWFQSFSNFNLKQVK